VDANRWFSCSVKAHYPAKNGKTASPAVLGLHFRCFFLSVGHRVAFPTLTPARCRRLEAADRFALACSKLTYFSHMARLLQVPNLSSRCASDLRVLLALCIALHPLAVSSNTIGSPAELGSGEFYGVDVPMESSNQVQSERSNSGKCGPAGCDVAQSAGTVAHAAVRPDKMRGDAFLEQVIQNAELPDMTESYEMITPLDGDSGGLVYMLVNDGMPYVLKLHKSGPTQRYAEFQKSLLKHASDAEAQVHPGYQAVYTSAFPVGWATHMGKKGLVFRYVVPSRKPRKPTAKDRAQLQDQIDFLHWLGYVHLDITDRNILLADESKCYLMDYDSVCKIGHVPLAPVPFEYAETPLLRRHPAHLDDDDHLWQHLQTTYFKDIPVEEDKTTPGEAKQQQQASGEGVCAPIDVLVRTHSDALC